MNKPSKLTIDFERDNENYSAVFVVTREENNVSYRMHAAEYDAGEKKIFEKERNGLDYSQIEAALMFVFHQAFVAEE